MIKLEKFTENDFDYLISWINNEEDLIQFAGTIFTFPLTKDQLYKYLVNPNSNAFKVIYGRENIPIGHAEIFIANNNIPKLCRIIIGNKIYRGKGLGQQIVKELLNISFNKFAATRVELNVFDWNQSAIKCYERVGFKINNSTQKEILVSGKSWISINMFIEKKNFYENKYFI